MKDSKFFSEQIRLWRIGKGLSLTKASKRFGISPRTFSNWERGMIPSDRQKERLSRELGLDKDVLFKKCEVGNINALLKEKRLEQGLTRTELAKHLGYYETTIRNWEKGLEISECEAEDICVYFGIEVYD
jgi:transcriptional regulator with XRE-family HTH domain|nr:MAG TPA: Repressor protein CI [Caudoviricetes sp.]